MRIKRSHRRIFKKNGNIYFIIIFLLSISLGLGYSIISTTLKINGTTTIKKANWDVHFDNVQVNNASTSTSNNISLNSDYTQLTFTTTLEEPGDFYEFNVDVVNDGSIDAMVSTIATTGLTTAQQEYISFTATYADGTAINAKDKLTAQTSKNILVRVNYKNVDKIFEEDQLINLTLTITYVQADSTAVDPSTATGVFANKKVIVVGDADNDADFGITTDDLVTAANQLGGVVVLEMNYSYQQATAAALDLEKQKNILALAEQYGSENIVVITSLGFDTEGLEGVAETVSLGDPTYAGPLAGVALNIPTYHICEPTIKNNLDTEFYEEKFSLLEMIIDIDEITSILDTYR